MLSSPATAVPDPPAGTTPSAFTLVSQVSNGVPPSAVSSTIFALIHEAELVFSQAYADVPVGQMSFEAGFHVPRFDPQSVGAVYAGLPFPSCGEPVNHE